jgi:hypothetical protein
MPRKAKVQTLDEKAGITPVTESVQRIELVINAGKKEEDRPVKPPRAKRILSDEQKAVLRERLVKARSARAAKKTETAK